jgi:hypothetical protein
MCLLSLQQRLGVWYNSVAAGQRRQRCDDTTTELQFPHPGAATRNAPGDNGVWIDGIETA